MAAQEHRRVANQPRPARTAADWESLRRTLLALVAQFKAADAHGCYTIDVKVVVRDRTQTPA